MEEISIMPLFRGANFHGRQDGAMLIEALIGAAILALVTYAVMTSFAAQLASREGLLSSRSLRRVEDSIRIGVTQQYIERSRAPANCATPQSLPQLTRNKLGPVTLTTWNRSVVPDTAPNNWLRARQRCDGQQVRTAGRQYECVRIEAPGFGTNAAFAEIEVTKRDFTSQSLLASCSAYASTASRGVRIAYTIYAFRQVNGRQVYSDASGIHYASAANGALPTPPPLAIVTPRTLWPKADLANCPASGGTTSSVQACYNFANEKAVTCGAVRSRCPLPNIPPAFPTAGQCTAWLNFCNSPLSTQFPADLNIKVACEDLSPAACPIPGGNRG